MIAPIPCSRTPKCSVRPYGPPDHIFVWRSAGRNDGSPLTAVLLLSARSADPPHSSGSAGYRAASTSPEALRVAMPFGDRKSTRLNSSHLVISYAVFCLQKKKKRLYMI